MPSETQKLQQEAQELNCPLNRQQTDDANDSDAHAATGEDRRAYDAPDGGWGWVVVASSFFIHALMDGFTFSYGVIAAELALDEATGATRQENGWTSSMLTGIKLGAGPLVGLASKRFGDRPVTIVGACVAAAGLAVSYFAVQPWILVLSIGVLTGIGTSLMYLPTIVIVGVYFEKRHSTAIGIAYCGSGLGMIAFGPLINLLIDAYTWRGSLLILSGILLNCAVFACLMRPLPRKPKSEKKSTLVSSRSKYIGLLRDPLFLLFLMSNLLFNVGFDTPFLYAPDRARQAGYSAVSAALLMSTLGKSNIVGRFSFGVLSDMLAACHRIDKPLLFAGTMGAAAAAALFGIASESYAAMLAHCAAFGFFIGAYITLTPAVCADMLGADRLSDSFGLALFCDAVGVLVGPPLTGAIYDATGSFNASYLTAAGFMFLGCAIVLPLSWLLKCRHRRAMSADTGIAHGSRGQLSETIQVLELQLKN